MTRDDQEGSKRRSLTPIGDELVGKPPPNAEPSRLALIRRRVRRLTRRPKNRIGSIGYGLAIFAIAVAVLAGLAYGLGLLLDRPSNLGHNLSLLVVFLLLSAATGLIASRTSHPAFGLALAAGFLAIGFGFWGRGTQERDTFPEELAAVVAPDWGRHSATCKRHRGEISLCRVQDAMADRFSVCVTWRLDPGLLLVYLPLEKCGLDAPGLTSPPLRTTRYRASATANCLRLHHGADMVEISSVEPFTDTGTQLVVTFQPPHRVVRSVLDAYFLRDAAEAERWRRSLAENIPERLRGQALYRRRNAVLQWGNPRPAYASTFNSCLRT